MKFIKKFENISNEYYFKINIDEYKYIHKKSVKYISTLNIEKIKEHLGKKCMYFANNMFAFKFFYDNNVNVFISECDDDWWLIKLSGTFSSDYYKCDQMDGLIKFLEDSFR